VVDRATSVARGAIDAVVGVVVVLFVGLYLAADPAPYVRGLLRLVPIPRRRAAAEAVFAVGYVLRWWLVGQTLAMTLVGIVVGVGLALIGVPLAFALGVLAGLLEFVPFLGPLLAFGPALLLALADDPQKAIYVVALYAAIQAGEGYVLTPLVQRRAVHLPPVVTITAQVGLSWAAGALGLLLAVPLTATALILIQMLYVERTLGDRLSLDAKRASREELAGADFLQDVLPPPAAARPASLERPSEQA
jgi:predicted PurR-regulated permease PerM